MLAEASERNPVLVVDGDELVRWSVAEGLREQGFPVAVAASAREALEHYAHAAVALLDDDLPDADGLATAERLRRRDDGCAVVLMTADPTPALRRRAREEGVATVLKKPFSLDSLVAIIRDALDGRAGPPRPRPGSPAGPDGEGGDGPGQTGVPHGH